MSAAARSERDDQPRIPLGKQIDDVEGRLYRRRLDARNHAAKLGIGLRGKLASPLTLVGAAGLGFGVAWFYRRRKPDDKPAVENDKQPTSVLATIMSTLNFAGMVVSMFPQPASFVESDSDPR